MFIQYACILVVAAAPGLIIIDERNGDRSGKNPAWFRYNDRHNDISEFY